MLTEYDRIRYNRQMMFSRFGQEGQEKLRKSRVVVAGIGGLGSPISLYLASAGIGQLTLIDHDLVELSNLNRQIIHWDEDIGEKKVLSGERKLARLNPTVEIKPVHETITPASVDRLLKGASVVVDGMDNFETRFVLNAACVRLGIPFVHGAIHGLFGQITTIIPGRTPCYACMYPEIPERLAVFPVFGPTPGLIASLQVMETIKLIAGFGDLLAGRMLFVDGVNMEFTTVDLTRNNACKVCSAAG